MEYRLRPSAAGVWVVCGGMVQLLQHVPDHPIDDIDPVVREEGTACHWAAHRAALGQPVPVGTIAPNGVLVDDEMIDATHQWLGAISSWGVPAYFETEVHCSGIHALCGGTSDAFAWDAQNRIVYVADLKYGFRFVDVVRNWQLLCYLDGVLGFFGLRANMAGITVVFMICQPRSYGNVVRELRTPLEALFPSMGILVEAAKLAVSAQAQCVTNVGCPNCDARHICKAALDAASSVCEVSAAPTPHALAFSAAESELVRLQRSAEILEARITGLEGQVTHAIKSGSISRHFELKRKVSREVWREDTAPQVLAIAALLKENIVNEPKLITPTQAKKKLPAELVEKYSHRPAGALKLTPADVNKTLRLFGKKT